MSSRRRLVSGSSDRRAQDSRTSETAGSASLDLPPYEAPSCPLNDEGRTMLRDLANARINDHLKKHLAESAKLLPTTVYETLETVASRKRSAASIPARDIKRRKEGEERIQELGEKVSPLTMQLEQAMREMLDLEVALQDEKQALQDLPRLVTQAQQTLAEQQQETNQEDDAVPPELTGVPILKILKAERNKKNALYNKLSMQAKYAQHNSYINFRRSWNDGLCIEEETPVPDPSTWFDQDGRPQHIIGRESADDDEIQISRENKSFRCPLSLVEMTEPYTCRRCGHSFQKENITQYLNGSRGGATCPQSACNITVSQSQLATENPMVPMLISIL